MSVATISKGVAVIGTLTSGTFLVCPLGVVRWLMSHDATKHLILACIPGQKDLVSSHT